jgi:hypothetical protein
MENNNTFDEIKAYVSHLEDVIFHMKSGIRELEVLKELKEAQLKELCEKRGHDFLVEPDDDYHKPGWYYTCRHCNYWTKQRPKNM